MNTDKLKIIVNGKTIEYDIVKILLPTNAKYKYIVYKIIKKISIHLDLMLIIIIILSFQILSINMNLIM